MAAKASPCHMARIGLSLGDGVLIGSCSICNQSVVRVNPRTGVEEWLGTFEKDPTTGVTIWQGGISPWTQRDDLLPV